MNARNPDLSAHRIAARALACAALLVLSAPDAFAQLDPLLFLKRMPPNVVVVLDTSFRMLDDGSGTYYDPFEYTAVANDLLAAHYGIAQGTRYRRRFVGLQFDSGVNGAGRYAAADIVAVSSASAGYANFYRPTRFEIARRGILQAMVENSNLDAAGMPVDRGTARTATFGLVRLPQAGATWAPVCDQPVSVPGASPLASLNDNGTCPGSGHGSFGIRTPSWSPAAMPYDTTRSNYTVDPATNSPILANPSATTYDPTRRAADLLNATIGNGTVIPAGADTSAYQDRPLTLALREVRKMMAGPTCQNNVVVLVTGGGNDGPADYLASNDVAALAATFLSVGGKRMPIYVVAITPADADEPQLQRIADSSGGLYVRASSAAEVTRAVNLAVQAGFANSTDFNEGRETEYLPVSPIVGTVNLDHARLLSGSSIEPISRPDGTSIPQRSNMTLTAGFAVGGRPRSPVGFDGRLRAFRTYRTQVDTTKTVGHEFLNDGEDDMRLWPDVDGRPDTANLARVPHDPATRNVYTYVPGSGVVRFSLDAPSVAAIAPHLGGADPQTLIPFVRSLPLGAIVGSTPALMDPPSLDPAPDDEYGRSDSDGTYAGRYRDRRSIIWFGANDGMVHGVDARTGFEVWAFIPFNLLPKLRTLLDGQPVHQFDYFVDSSPKIAEAKITVAGKRQWRSLLLIGQGPGGTFYQAFDVTEAGMGVSPESDNHLAVVQTFSDPARVRFLWAFPDYANFDTTYDGTFALVNGDGSAKDATPGSRIRLYGDLAARASPVEKSVGLTWSDPAVGALTDDRSVSVAIVGSGYLPDIEHLVPNRAADSPVVRAGRALYLLHLDTGRILGGGNTCTGTGCRDVGDVVSSQAPLKNALQADPTAASTPGGYVVRKAYLGDLDGKYWRFDFTTAGAIAATAIMDPFAKNWTPQPIFGSSALLIIGTTKQYAFFATGSDLLPADAPAGKGPFSLYAVDGTGTAAPLLLQSLAWQDPTSKGPRGRALDGAYERPSTSPSVAQEIVFFTTTTTYPGNVCSGDSCDAGAGGCGLVGNLYAFTYTGGPAYDTNGDGTLTTSSKKGDADSTKLTSVRGRATAPFIVDQHLYFATSGAGGANLEVFGNPEDYNNGIGQVGVRILSWRELR